MTLSTVAAAQSAGPAPAPGQTQPQPAPKALPQVLLGQRVLAVQHAAAVCGTVVIVGDGGSYVEAISHWTPRRRFPVLIDDGTPAAREDIARFVRAFKPAHVVRFAAKQAAPPQPLDTIEPAALFAAVARVWGVQGEKPSQGQVLDAWKKIGYEPPGLIVTQSNDGAWPAALALSAGRSEPVVFIPVRQAVDEFLTVQQADDLEAQVEAAASVSGFSWEGIGDALDAVTMCNNAPARMQGGKDGEYLALTDRIGRVSKGTEDGKRWAWCGQIFGNPEQSCYRAMCSLFLTSHRGWIFDGYGTGKPWSDYDGTAAGENLKKVGMNVEVLDTPRQGAKDWRLRAARAVDADLILINSSGNPDFFKLEPGQCKPGDIPFLEIPAALHMVHSWSVEFPKNRDTVGGRWFERGVFAYAGSVHEPYLQAFVPTPGLALRLMAGAPFGVAVRHDNGQLWRIAVLGDPLYTLGGDLKRIDEAPLEGTTDVEAGLRELLTGGKFAQALGVLTLLGRDAQGAELARGLMAQKPEAFTGAVAAVSVLPLFRAGDNKSVLSAFSKLDGEHAKDPVLRDALWLATYPLLEQPTDEMLRVLLANLRADQMGRDAADLATAWAAKNGRAQAEAMLKQVRATLKEQSKIEAFDQAVKAAPEKWAL